MLPFLCLAFVLLCLLTGVLAFPALAGRLRHLTSSLSQRTGQHGQAGWRLLPHACSTLASALRRLLHRMTALCLRHRWQLLLILFAVSAPPSIALLWLGDASFTGYGLADRTENVQIAELLKGERLQPPAPLPPLLFAAPEVAEALPLPMQASRNWSRLDPAFTQKLLVVFRIMRDRHGYEMALLEGYRSPERQQMLSSMGSHVTKAGAFQSYHQFGLAADCAFVRNGKLVISEKDPWAMLGYQLYGAVAEEVGLIWGGRWSMRDYGHAELRDQGRRNK